MWFFRRQKDRSLLLYFPVSKRAYLFWIKSDYLISLETGHLGLISASYILICILGALFFKLKGTEEEEVCCAPVSWISKVVTVKSPALRAPVAGPALAQPAGELVTWEMAGSDLHCFVFVMQARYLVGFASAVSWIESWQMYFCEWVACGKQNNVK